MPSAWGFSVRGENTDTLEIDIYDIVGGGGFFFDGVTAQSIRRQLKANKSAQLIKLRINSDGGDVFDGFAIYNLLNEHPARVEVDIDALAASVASVIAMAADEIRIAENAWVMIHNAWGTARGEAEDLRRWAKVLEDMSAQAASIYAARTGLAVPKVRELMDAETWMPAAEAKRLGFVDSVTPAKPKPAGDARASAEGFFASMRLEDFENVPAELRERVQKARAAQPRLQPNNTPQPTTPAPRAPDNTPSTGEGNNAMDDTLKAFLAAHGIDKAADLTARLGLLTRLEALTDKAGEEAFGALNAAVLAAKEVPELRSKVAELQKAGEGHELDAVLKAGKDAKKVTPAIETSLRKQYADKQITLQGVKATVDALPAIAALAPASGGAPPVMDPALAAAGSSEQGGARPMLEGKFWEQLRPIERANLKSSCPDLYAAMRVDAQKRGVLAKHPTRTNA